MKGIPREIVQYITPEWVEKARALLRESYDVEPEEVMTEARVNAALGALRLIFERMQKERDISADDLAHDESGMRSLLDGALDFDRATLIDGVPVLPIMLCIALLHMRRLSS
jgi:hypothetical protein